MWSLCKFVVFLPPTPRRAPEFIGGRVINPSRADQARWIAIARPSIPEELKSYRGAVELRVESVFRRPFSHYKRGIRGDDTRLKVSAPRFHTQRPDTDNLTKFIGDALSGVAYHDDR